MTNKGIRSSFNSGGGGDGRLDFPPLVDVRENAGLRNHDAEPETHDQHHDPRVVIILVAPGNSCCSWSCTTPHPARSQRLSSDSLSGHCRQDSQGSTSDCLDTGMLTRLCCCSWWCCLTHFLKNF
jgi:hypothetical protein